VNHVLIGSDSNPEKKLMGFENVFQLEMYLISCSKWLLKLFTSLEMNYQLWSLDGEAEDPM
jgi:hypothetical protein